jgi:hypothetical protein
VKATTGHFQNNYEPHGNGRLARLRSERRKLETRLTKLDSEIAQLAPSRRVTAAKFNRWLDELAQGLPKLSLLPTDFSRVDL